MIRGSTYLALIGWFLSVPCPEVTPLALVHQDDAVTNRAAHPGQGCLFLNWKLQG